MLAHACVRSGRGDGKKETSFEIWFPFARSITSIIRSIRLITRRVRCPVIISHDYCRHKYKYMYIFVGMRSWISPFPAYDFRSSVDSSRGMAKRISVDFHCLPTEGAKSACMASAQCVSIGRKRRLRRARLRRNTNEQRPCRAIRIYYRASLMSRRQPPVFGFGERSFFDITNLPTTNCERCERIARGGRKKKYDRKSPLQTKQFYGLLV